MPPLSKINFSGQRKSTEPFRPMLDRFQDDPVELNVHTEMQSMGFGPGRDMSVLIAENLDKMQKEYLTAAAQRTQSESFEMVQANQDQRFRSN